MNREVAKAHFKSQQGSALVISLVATTLVSAFAYMAFLQQQRAAEAASRSSRMQRLTTVNDFVIEYTASALRADIIKVSNVGFLIERPIENLSIESKGATGFGTSLIYSGCPAPFQSAEYNASRQTGKKTSCENVFETRIDFLQAFTFIDQQRQVQQKDEQKTKASRAALVKISTLDPSYSGVTVSQTLSLEAFSGPCPYFTRDGDPTSVSIPLDGSGSGMLGMFFEFDAGIPFRTLYNYAKKNPGTEMSWQGNDFVIDNFTWYNDTKIPIDYALGSPKNYKKFVVDGWDHQHSFDNRGSVRISNAHLNTCEAKYTAIQTTYIRGCIHRESRVTMADGSLKPLHQLAAGDLVWNPMRRAGQVVDQLFMGNESSVDAIDVKLSSGELNVTGNHPVATSRGIIKAGDLRIGDRLTMAEQAPAEVISIVTSKAPRTDYLNLVISKNSDNHLDHFLVVDNIVVGDFYIQNSLGEQSHAKSE